jgi:cyclopropane fatty-acyl-phospholipid synthase-like methyltransferase
VREIEVPAGMNSLRVTAYDFLISRMTASWYRAVLMRLPAGCRLLDVGIGTGAALLANASLLRERDVRVMGVDVDRDYVERCRREVSRTGLAERIEVRLESVDDHRGGPYEAVYFSASFMLLPDPSRALRHVGALLTPGGRIYFTQMFEHEPSRLTERVKPLLHLVTTIDFGRVTYEKDFRATLAAAGVEVEEVETIGAGRRRSSRLVMARSSPG